MIHLQFAFLFKKKSKISIKIALCSKEYQFNQKTNYSGFLLTSPKHFSASVNTIIRIGNLSGEGKTVRITRTPKSQGISHDLCYLQLLYLVCMHSLNTKKANSYIYTTKLNRQGFSPKNITAQGNTGNQKSINLVTMNSKNVYNFLELNQHRPISYKDIKPSYTLHEEL